LDDFKSEDPKIRLAAVGALAKITNPPPAVVPALIEELESLITQNLQYLLSDATITVLEEHGDARAITVLSRVLREPRDGNQRDAAREALRRIGGLRAHWNLFRAAYGGDIATLFFLLSAAAIVVLLWYYYRERHRETEWYPAFFQFYVLTVILTSVQVWAWLVEGRSPLAYFSVLLLLLLFTTAIRKAKMPIRSKLGNGAYAFAVLCLIADVSLFASGGVQRNLLQAPVLLVLIFMFDWELVSAHWKKVMEARGHSPHTAGATP
jgi:HEAT repeat protein